MKIGAKQPAGKLREVELTVPLKSLSIGDCFRWPHVTEAEASASMGEAYFRVCADIGAAQTGRRLIMSLDCKVAGYRDEDRHVIVHEMEVLISPSKKTTNPNQQVPDEPTEGPN